MKKIKNKIFYLVNSIALSLLAVVILYSSYSVGLFYGIENFFEDILFHNKPIDRDIVILSIDNDSIQKIGQWPWPRAVFSNIFNKLEDFKPSTVALDVLMSEKSRFGLEDDENLAYSLKKINYPLIIPVEAKDLELKGETPQSRDFIFPIPGVSEAPTVKLAHVNLISDRDGVVRNFPSLIKDNFGKIYKSLSYETAISSGRFIDHEKIDKVERIVFSGGNGTIRRFSVKDFLDDKISKKEIENKIIFIGSTATNLHDEKQTPMDKGTEMSGVEIQAQIANMILKGYYLENISDKLLLLWLFIAFLIPFVVSYFIRGVLLAFIINILFGFLHIFLVIYFFDRGFVANLVHINLSWILGVASSFVYRYLSIDKEKREMRNIFSKYVSSDVLNEILNDPSKVKLGGEEREVTVFFSDVRSFTTLSEGMSPQKLTHFLNKYLTRMTNIILKRRGVVDKYIGDAIMSFWGAPVSNDYQATDAVNSSLEMVESLSEFNKENKIEGDPEIDIGIGLNFGRVTVGNMGSNARFDYTVMGDTVNLASRLEGQTKNYGVKIIISESVVEKLRLEKTNNNFLIREIDKIKVKGKNKPVTIYEVVPTGKKEKLQPILKSFEEFRELYYMGRFEEGTIVAGEILKKISDSPTKVLMDRCFYFLKNPPELWDGVYEMKNK